MTVSDNQNLLVNRVKAFPLKDKKSGKNLLVERIFMRKLKNSLVGEYSVNFNFVLKEIEKLESVSNGFDEKGLLNELKWKIRSLSTRELGALELKILSEVFMTIIKLNTQKTAL